MKRFADNRSWEVFTNGFLTGVRKDLTRKARWYMHLLVAAESWQDVAVIGRVATWSRIRRFGLQIDGKWFVTFEWEPYFGAKEIKFERK
jgi:hypothetical protein